MKKKQLFLLASAVLLAIILVAGGTALYFYHQLFRKPCLSQTHWVYVTAGDSYESVLSQITGSDDPFWLQQAARFYKLPQRVASGRLQGAYRLDEGLTAAAAVRRVAYHQQTPVRVSFLSARTLGEVAGRMSRTICADSLSLLQAMTDTAFVRACGTDSLNIASLFLPDTYEVYWDITPQQLMQRMHDEWQRFWNDKRRSQAEALGLTPWQASVLCSIAEEETASRAERGVVARLYLNRLQRGMLLQADPTVKFALGDATIRRILLAHLSVQSPYNTYLHPGLPPGPIRVVDKATLDALLGSKPHNYLYMCAKEDFSGLHNFATTLAEHNRNAARYHAALNAKHIK